MTQNTVTINGVPIYVDSAALLSLLIKPKEVLMKDYAKQWYETFKKKKLRPKTQITYEYLLRKHIFPFFGDMFLGDIDVSTVQKFYDEKSHLSRSTLHNTQVILHQIFKSAIEDKLINSNPTESERLTYSTRCNPREALNDDDIRDIIRQLPRLKGSDSRLINLMIYTGMRRGEIVGLRWEDIDFENNMIHVRRAATFISNKPILGETKSKCGLRDIPLLPELKAVLEKDRQEEGFVIGKGDAPITEVAYRRAFERIVNKMELHNATAHIFRHTFLTTAASTLDLRTLQAIAGHASHVTTMGYVHKRDEKIRNAQIQLTGMFQQSTKNN